MSATLPPKGVQAPSANVGAVPSITAVNDFVIKFANVNGSGSASANELFAKAILRMGVPVSRATSSRATSRACRRGTKCASPSRATWGGAVAPT